MERWRLGHIIRNAALPLACDGLKLAARKMRAAHRCGTAAPSPQSKRSPAANGVPPLLTLDAVVEIASGARGWRSVALGRSSRAIEQQRCEDELVIAVRLPRAPASARATFLKLGTRAYLVISIASVAVMLDPMPIGAWGVWRLS